jgi:hypothetical protein
MRLSCKEKELGEYKLFRLLERHYTLIKSKQFLARIRVANTVIEHGNEDMDSGIREQKN